ncbi:WD40 repeat domain-containing protein [Halomicronema hongdechloris]|uniref:WD40 repeat domain-containing protein n=1 Tax=Halomicronema hongdechloris TaxID=1209493 RepID=UPI0016511860|nr:WD40 repeat domain-containing protein [Halomicronema hongdechloris]
MGGALAGKAQEIYERLNQDEQAIARRVFVGLVQLGEGTRDTRRRAALESLVASRDTPEAVKQVIHRFASPGARLVTLAHEAKQETAEVTHEALFDHWQQLYDWLDSSRDDIRFQRRLEAAATYWEKQGRPEGLLWRRPDLDLLHTYFASFQQDMTTLQLQFYQASTRARKLRKILVWGIVGALGVMTGGIAWFGRQAHRTAFLSKTQQLALQAESLVSQQEVQQQKAGALLAVKSWQQFQLMKKSSLEVDRALRSSLNVLPESEFIYLDHINEIVSWGSIGITSFTIGHNYFIDSAIFSPDGEKIVVFYQTPESSFWSGEARIWDVATQKEIFRIDHEVTIDSVTFSSDGEKIFYSSTDEVFFGVDVSTQKELFRFELDSPVDSIVFNSDGKSFILAFKYNPYLLEIRDIKSGKKIREITDLDLFQDFSFRVDDAKIISINLEGIVKTWDIHTGKEINQIQIANLQKFDYAVKLSPDGKRFISSSEGDDGILLWDTFKGSRISWISHADYYSALFSHNGKWFAFLDKDGVLKVHRSSDGKEVFYSQDGLEVKSFKFSPNESQIAFVTADDMVRVWSINVRREVARFNHEGYIRAINFSLDGTKIASASVTDTGLSNYWIPLDMPTLKVWNVDTDTNEEFSLKHNDSINFATFNPDGTNVISASDDGTARLWNTYTGQELKSFDHKNPVLFASFNPTKNQIVSVDADKTLRVWDIKTGLALEEIKHEHNIEFAAFSADGSRLFSLSYSGDRETPISNRDSTIRVWDTNDYNEIIHTDSGFNRNIFFSSDSKWLAHYDGEDWRFWNTDTGQEVSEPNYRKGFLINFRDLRTQYFNPEAWDRGKPFSPDGSRIFRSDSLFNRGLVEILELPSERNKISQFTHGHQFNDADFSPNGELIVSSSDDDTIRVWKTSDGSEVARFSHKNTTSVAFSPDGTRIVSTSANHTAKIWLIDTAELAARVCQRVKRNLTSEEWLNYIGSELTEYELTCPDYPVHPSLLDRARIDAARGDIRSSIVLLNHLIRISKTAGHTVDLDPSTESIEQDPKAYSNKIAADSEAEQ